MRRVNTSNRAQNITLHNNYVHVSVVIVVAPIYYNTKSNVVLSRSERMIDLTFATQIIKRPTIDLYILWTGQSYSLTLSKTCEQWLSHVSNYRGIDLVRELQWLSISQRINYFLCVLVFNCIHGNAPRYLSDSIDMASRIHDINTRLNMSSDVDVPLGRTHYMRSSFIYRGAVAWNALPNAVKGHCLLSELI